jgi:hypothetical protein
MGHMGRQNRPIIFSSLRIEDKEYLETCLIVLVNLVLFSIYEYKADP